MDTWWARAGFGIAATALWALLLFAVGNLWIFPRLAESESRSGIPWLVVGTLGFTVFSIATVVRSPLGRALLSAWGLALPWLLSLLLLFVFLAFSDGGTRASFPNGAPEDEFYWPHLSAWPSYLSILATLANGILVAIDRVLPHRQMTRWLVIAGGALPFPILGVLILPEL